MHLLIASDTCDYFLFILIVPALLLLVTFGATTLILGMFLQTALHLQNWLYRSDEQVDPLSIAGAWTVGCILVVATLMARIGIEHFLSTRGAPEAIHASGVIQVPLRGAILTVLLYRLVGVPFWRSYLIAMLFELLLFVASASVAVLIGALAVYRSLTPS